MKLMVVVAASIAVFATDAAAATLATVRARGALTCGVVTEAPDWNKEDLHGDLSALGVAICSAMAVAALGRPDAVDIHRFAAEDEALGGLAGGKVDVVVGVTPSVTRTVQYGVSFGPAVFWDTQTFLVRRALGVVDAEGLAGKTVCYIDGTELGLVLLAGMKTRAVAIRPFPFQEEGEMSAGLTGGHCGAIGGYASRLADMRAQMRAPAGDFVLLPEVLAVAPAGVATRQDDTVWSTIVAATVDAVVQAEMLGLTRANLQQRRRGDDPVVRHLLGEDWSAGLSLGLAHDWSAQIVAALGNYGEIFARTVGENSALGLKRGLNAVCVQGGTLCAPPVR